MNQLLNRRLFGATLLAGAGALTARVAIERIRASGLLADRRKPRSRVAILSADSYTAALETTITDGLRLFDLDLRGKTVLLKPNLVEFIPGTEVNTNPLLVGAAADAFRKLGAKTVTIAEGPGHQRDTYLVVAENGLEEQLRERRLRFVDLNRDEIVRVPLKTGRAIVLPLRQPASREVAGEVRRCAVRRVRAHGVAPFRVDEARRNLAANEPRDPVSGNSAHTRAVRRLRVKRRDPR